MSHEVLGTILALGKPPGAPAERELRVTSLVAQGFFRLSKLERIVLFYSLFPLCLRSSVAAFESAERSIELPCASPSSVLVLRAW